MNAHEFFKTLYNGVDEGQFTIWTLQDKKTGYFKVTDIPAALKYAESLIDTHDIYFGVGLRGIEKGSYARGCSEDVSVITAFWTDVDIKGPAHKEKALPLTKEEALAFLDGLPIKPSIIIFSGNGLHVYWLLDKPLYITDAQQRKQIESALNGWQNYVNAAARDQGWRLDKTSDLSRVLRVPGSINHKTGGSGGRVEVIAKNDVKYALSDFDAYRVPAHAQKESSDGTTPFTGTMGSGEKILEQCAFMRHCKDNVANLPEPSWYAAVSNMALCSDGEALCHDISKDYPGYTFAETDAKIAHARKVSKPHTCAFVRESLDFDCGDCAANCKAPVALAVITKAETVRQLLDKEIEDYTVLFDNEYLDALSYAKNNLPIDFAKYKMKLKGKINLVELEKCIKAYGEKLRAAAADYEEDELLLHGIDLGGAVIPRRWDVSVKHGVRRAVSYKDGDCEVIACPSPVVVTRSFYNLDDGKEQLELTFWRDGRWKSVIGSKTKIYNKNTIQQYADDGLHITSGTAGELVNYLSDYETVNASKIPRLPSISRLGWLDAGNPCGNDQFFPYATDKEILFEEDHGTAILYRNLAAQGDYAVWKDMMRKLRKNSVARFLTSASFASPLLCKIGVRTFVILLWYLTASGKTAALKAGISVWGNPLRIMGNGFTTIVGTEQLAGTLRNIPFGIDEKQSADEKRLNMEHLVYVLGQGSGKIRGAKGGGNAEVATWHNIIMLTGEEPITKNSSMDGVHTRAFELYGKPIDDMDFAKDVHIISENNYGHAGAEFMKAVCRELKADKEYLRREYLRISEAFKEEGLKGVHADYVAAVTLGDILAETIIFGIDPAVAREEAMACGREIYALHEAHMSTDVVERAWDFVKGWLVSNEQFFSTDTKSVLYGKKEMSPGCRYDEYFVIPQYLDAALEANGFNVKKTFQGFRDRKLIIPENGSDGKVRTKSQFRLGDSNLRGYHFQLEREGAICPATKEGKEEFGDFLQ